MRVCVLFVVSEFPPQPDGVGMKMLDLKIVDGAVHDSLISTVPSSKQT